MPTGEMSGQSIDNQRTSKIPDPLAGSPFCVGIDAEYPNQWSSRIAVPLASPVVK